MWLPFLENKTRKAEDVRLVGWSLLRPLALLMSPQGIHCLRSDFISGKFKAQLFAMSLFEKNNAKFYFTARFIGILNCLSSQQVTAGPVLYRTSNLKDGFFQADIAFGCRTVMGWSGLSRFLKRTSESWILWDLPWVSGKMGTMAEHILTMWNGSWTSSSQSPCRRRTPTTSPWWVPFEHR